MSYNGNRKSSFSSQDFEAASWTAESEDIRDGTARLASLGLGDLEPDSDLDGGSRSQSLLSRRLTAANPPDPVDLRRRVASPGVSNRTANLVSSSLAVSSPLASQLRRQKADEESQIDSSAPSYSGISIETPKPDDGISGIDANRSEPFSVDDDDDDPEAHTPRETAETTPLLQKSVTHFDVLSLLNEGRTLVADSIVALPAVFLGCLLNILDGVSYGMIMFPTNLPDFSDYAGIGVSMFFVTVIVSQLTYSLGASAFKGGNGTMMIEVIPFYNSLVSTIYTNESDHGVIVSSTLFSFGLSSVLTGIFFYGLGHFRLGSLSGFFPRHILVGCIGGIGSFLIETGFQVSGQLPPTEEELPLLETLAAYMKVWPLWAVSLFIAFVVRGGSMYFKHPLIFPALVTTIPFIFYFVAIVIFRQSIAQLRHNNWVFSFEGGDSKWYDSWRLFNIHDVAWSTLIKTIPTQLALVFFGLLHVPINVPALGISIGQNDIDTDRELVAHGYSNILAGLVGSVPNYLCYVNSVLFYRVGGDTRLSGVLLALASVGILLAGPGLVSYLPVSMIGALIFILGMDLVKEAIYDTWGRVSNIEYVTIFTIVFVMTFWDFVVGIGVGVMLACVMFVVSSSRRRAIRSIMSGTLVRSTVRRHPAHGEFLRKVGRQTVVVRLQGFLFFGTISHCENSIKEMFLEHWDSNPIRFLILDFTLASGCDFSAAEAFLRLYEDLDSRGVIFVICGLGPDSAVGRALRSVGLWASNDDSAEAMNVEVFEKLNDALEHTENALLQTMFSATRDPRPRIDTSAPINLPTASQIRLPSSENRPEVTVESPRTKAIIEAATETLNRSKQLSESSTTLFHSPQPVPLLVQTLTPYSPELYQDFFFRLREYFTRITLKRNQVLFREGDPADALYLIEKGTLRASYTFEGSQTVHETIVAGNVAGELSFLSKTKRNADVVAERDSVLWCMDLEARLRMLSKESVIFSKQFEESVLRIAVRNQDVLMGHITAAALA